MNSGPGRRDVSLSDPAIVGRLLQQACGEIDRIEHAIMTSRDGLPIAANKESTGDDTADTLADRASAMAAAGAGIGDHFTQLVSHGVRWAGSPTGFVDHGEPRSEASSPIPGASAPSCPSARKSSATGSGSSSPARTA